jgi:hypothetical protein
VPEVAAGYWWSASLTTGFGTTGFRVLEGNGHSSFDLVQATVASQPTLLTENGGKQFRMRKQVDANPSRIALAAAVAAGWTGDTYIAGWFRLPDASGDVTGAGTTGTFFSHNTTAGNQRRLNLSNNAAPDAQTCTSNPTGLAGSATNTWPNQFVGGGWTWLELAIRAGVVHELYAGLVLVTAQTAVAAASPPLFNATALIGLACSSTGASSNTDTTDWASCYYANGIPTLANRVRLANYRNPSGTLLT